ncbi:hypothetical protein SpCBS45565_g00207 [Spizellomyces sp. 'palustris']|nr:hypothetical protein SpCBS45565_g00207 [Spizellomyces sp. 'palustris']
MPSAAEVLLVVVFASQALGVPRLTAYYRPTISPAGLGELSEYDGSYLSTLVYGYAATDEKGFVYWGNKTIATEVLHGNDEPACECCVFGGVGEVIKFKLKYPDVITELGFGGPAESWALPTLAALNASRIAFARNATNFMRMHGFEGLHISWEYPKSSGDWDNYLLLLQELRNYWNQLNSPMGYTLSISLPAVAPGLINATVAQIQGLANLAQRINIMPYREAPTAWTQYEGNLFNLPTDPIKDGMDAALAGYGQALPIDRTFLGINTMADMFEDVAPTIANVTNSTGVYSAFKLRNKESVSYRDIINTGKSSGYQEAFDSQRVGGSLYNPQTNTLIVSEIPDTVRAKSTYIQQRTFAGFALSSLGADLPSINPSALHQIAQQALGVAKPAQAKHALCTEDSNFCNLKTCPWVKSDKLVAKPWFMWVGLAAVIVWLLVYYVIGRVLFRCYNVRKVATWMDAEKRPFRRKNKSDENPTSTTILVEQNVRTEKA